MKTIEYDCQCDSCKGTGLYRGFAEKGGIAVVCHTCKGTGWRHVVIKYEETNKQRVRAEGVLRVLETNPGIQTGGKAGEIARFGGMPYEDWAQGKPFPVGSEMREYTCPAWWYQSANYALKPKWEECYSANMFSACKCFGNKAACWARFDAEIGR